MPGRIYQLYVLVKPYDGLIVISDFDYVNFIQGIVLVITVPQPFDALEYGRTGLWTVGRCSVWREL